MYNFQNTGYNYNPQQYMAELREKQALRRVALAVAIPGIIFFLITKFWGQAIIFAAGRFGITRQRVVEFLSEPAVLQLLQIMLSLFLLTVPFILCAKITGAKISDIVAINKPKGERNIAFLLFGVGFCAFANIAVATAGEIFKKFGIDYSTPKNDNPQGVFGFALVIISTAIVPALVEEFAFRGIVMGLLKPFGEVFCIYASAAAFGILHGNFEKMAFAFLVGLILGFIRIKTDSVLICMAVHAINNLVAVMSSYSSAMPRGLVDIIYTVYIMLALTFSVLGVAMLRGKDNFSFKEANTLSGTKKTYVNFFFSPVFIVFFLLFLFRAVAYIFI